MLRGKWLAMAWWVACAGSCFALAPPDEPAPTGLTASLLHEGASALTRAARERGDARRGARVFYRPSVGCLSCHAIEGQGRAVGPDLTQPVPNDNPERIAWAILEPSRTIREGFETVSIATRDGQVLSARHIRSSPSEVVVSDPRRPGYELAIPRTEIDECQLGGPSIMPSGLANSLQSRAEFLDLVRYLIALQEEGASAARSLEPAESRSTNRLPEHERDLDHARLIRQSIADPASLERGANVYARVCINCHGTPQEAGTLPTSLKFWSESLRNGADPYQMYQTLTHGYGQMPPQSWLVPRQKYDVIQYVRETYLKPRGLAAYVTVDDSYLASLPSGTSLGPEPPTVEPWEAMDYGPCFSATLQVGDDAANIACKAIAVRLDPGPGGVSSGRVWGMYDHDTLRMAELWSGSGFIDWNSIHLNGSHGVHPRTVGQGIASLPGGPGWADPATGRYDDPRPLGRDGKPYGPLPRAWAHFLGRYQHGSQSVLTYTVGEMRVLDSLSLESDAPSPVVRRTLNLAPNPHPARMKVADTRARTHLIAPEGVALAAADGFTELLVPSHAQALRIAILITHEGTFPQRPDEPAELEPLTHGTTPLFGQALEVPVVPGSGAPFAVDELGLPAVNPWQAQIRPTGLDFLEDGKALAVCGWDGDVWTVHGVDAGSSTLTWRRIASGLFQPLGIKVIQGQIYVTCRDQIVILRDLDGDGYTDFYENFNSDHQVTPHFHEFAMGLQVDAEGRLYYAKAACHGLKATVPQHGTLLRVSADGLTTEILATGFRAPNGVCLNGDGTFMMTDQEGFWLPKNRINWVRPGSFHGNVWGYSNVTDTSDSAMERPICWITNAFDRSPAEPLWVPAGCWGPLAGSLLNFSYGYGKIFVVPHERVSGDLMQGGMAALPVPQFPTGLVRGRFSPRDQALYTCGMFAWAGNQTQPGGLYRVRHTSGPIHAPLRVEAKPHSLVVQFSDPLDRLSATDPAHYQFRAWDIKRSQNYGSPHLNEHGLDVQAASLSEDGRTVSLTIEGLEPTRCYELTYDLVDNQGQPFTGNLDGTIHQLGD